MSTTQTTIKSFTFKIKVPVLNETELREINQKIAKAEEKAKVNKIRSIDNDKLKKIVTEKTPLENVGKKIKTIKIGNYLYSKSKQYSTTSTLVTIEFYKNGNVKSIKATREDFPNYKCYNGLDTNNVTFYS